MVAGSASCGLHGPGAGGSTMVHDRGTGRFFGDLDRAVRRRVHPASLLAWGTLRGWTHRQTLARHPSRMARGGCRTGHAGHGLEKKRMGPEVPARGRSSLVSRPTGRLRTMGRGNRSSRLAAASNIGGKGRPVAQQTESSIVIDASAAKVMEVIADLGTYPEWAGSRRHECWRRSPTVGPKRSR